MEPTALLAEPLHVIGQHDLASLGMHFAHAVAAVVLLALGQVHAAHVHLAGRETARQRSLKGVKKKKCCHFLIYFFVFWGGFTPYNFYRFASQMSLKGFETDSDADVTHVIVEQYREQRRSIKCHCQGSAVDKTAQAPIEIHFVGPRISLRSIEQVGSSSYQNVKQEAVQVCTRL